MIVEILILTATFGPVEVTYKSSSAEGASMYECEMVKEYLDLKGRLTQLQHERKGTRFEYLVQCKRRK